MIRLYAGFLMRRENSGVWHG